MNLYCGENPTGMREFLQIGARNIGPPSRRPTWAYVSDSVQEIKQMKMQSTYWLEKVPKMISLYVNALLCTLQHIFIHVMQLSGVNSRINTAVPVSTLHMHLFNFLYRVRDLRPHWSTRRRAGFRAPLCMCRVLLLSSKEF